MTKKLGKKARQNILKSIARIEMVLLILSVAIGFGKIQGTNSFFTDVAEVAGNEISAGQWIPTLTMTVSPDSADGKNGWYVSKPCIKLFSDIDDVTIHYSFTGENPENGTVAENTCIEVPEGTNSFSAFAENNANSSWISNTEGRDFKVDTVAPSVPDWERPADGSITHQSQHVLIDWSDSTDATSGVAGYIYENTKVGGSAWNSSEACPGHALMEESQFPNNQVGPGGTCIDAPSGSFSADGSYDRKVRAADVAGNLSGWSNEWRLTRDTVEPTSHSDAFSPATTSNLTFDVAYSASDDRAGVKNVKLFYRKDGGSWTQYGTTFSSSPISFAATGIGVYDFFTIAEDNADDLAHADMADGSDGDDGQGNVESKTPLVEATMTVIAPADGPGDVVINEVMWMGSFTHPNDEWIELRNTTGHPINLKNWNIEGAVEGSGGHLEIAGNAGHEGDDMIIPAHGYFLIANKDRDSSDVNARVDLVKTSISFNDEYDDNGPLILKDSTGQTIDASPTPSGHNWPAGIHGFVVPGGILHWSMERNNTPSSGWHTCDPTAMTPLEYLLMKSYWDLDAVWFNCGTPGHANLSKNDPSEQDILGFIEKTETKKGVVLESLLKNTNDAEMENIVKNIPIKITGALDVADGLKYKLKQKIKKVDVSGDFSDKEITIDLAKLGKIEKKGELKIKISDLALPDGVKIVSQKSKDLVLLITVKKNSGKSGKNSKKKQGSEIKPVEPAALLKTDDIIQNDPPKEDSKKGDGGGDGNSGII